jgi:hypothetical protein
MPQFERLIKNAYAEETLSASRLAAILADTRQIRDYHTRRLVRYTALAAMVSGVVLFSSQIFKRNTITETVLQELATSHQSGLGMEVKATSYEELSRKMNQVRFPIKPANDPIIDRFYTVRGARYNTVGGALAAQVVLTSNLRRQNHTLYATRMTEELSQVKPAFYQRDGVRIRVWTSNDMFYAMARTAAGP